MPLSIPKELKAGATSERHFQISVDRAAIDEEKRTVEVAFASEYPVERYWGVEVLDVQSRSIRMDRLKSGGAVLMDHNRSDQVGVIDSVQIGSDRVARAVLRFGKSARASEVFQDVVDGIRTNTSVNYRIHAAQLESEAEGVGTYRVTDWEPTEISLVSIPADPSVGVGRADDKLDPKPKPEAKTMPEATENRTDPPAPTRVEADPAKLQAERQNGATNERKRVADINAMAKQLTKYDGMRDLADEAVASGMGADEFRARALEHVATKPLPNANIGMSQREQKQFSVVRLLNAMANPSDHRARERAAFEMECSRAAAEIQGREVRGVLVPHDVLTQSREQTVGTSTAGGDLVATQLLTSNFIDLLRNKMVINRMGAQMLTGLVGNIAIPRQTGGATAYWVAESGSGSESDSAFDQVPMSPKTLLGRTQISRKLLVQSAIGIENFIRNDLATVLGLAMQAAAIKGGGSNEPTGILATSGIGDVVGGTDGANPTLANIVALETAVAVANADVGTLGYLTNAKVRGYLKSTQRFSGSATGQTIWDTDSGDTPLNGYQTGITNAVPSNLTKGTSSGVCSAILYGNFADLIIGMWGGLELQVDPYSAGDSGAVVVRAFQDTDIAVRHKESFSAMLDALTS